MCAPVPPEKCIFTRYKQGSRKYRKMSFPLHSGIFSVLETPQSIFHFNLNNEIIRTRSKGKDWSHPHEWLKRTAGNDWVYYSTGGYTGVVEATGEYYLPNFRYPSNSLLGGNPFSHSQVNKLVESWYCQLEKISKTDSMHTADERDFLEQILANNPNRLQQKADTLFEIIGGRISVLPPDGRHVDYNIIPLNISLGCLYKCGFCKVKNNIAFSEKSEKEISAQLVSLKELYGADMKNQNSLFLGEHDALHCNPLLILFSIKEALKAFGFDNSFLAEKYVFLFGSVSSLLNAPDQLFNDLQHLPIKSFINIGMESADQATLDELGKPLTEKLIKEAFRRVQEINDNYPNIEITCNFIMDSNLPEEHYPKTMNLLREQQSRTNPKGTIYFSPLTFNQPSRARLFEFNRLKVLSRFPTYLYIIQRL